MKADKMDKFACRWCSKVIKRKYDFERHLKIVHPSHSVPFHDFDDVERIKKELKLVENGDARLFCTIVDDTMLEKKDRIRGLELKRVEHAEFYQFIKELVSECREYKIVLSEFTKQ